MARPWLCGALLPGVLADLEAGPVLFKGQARCDRSVDCCPGSVRHVRRVSKRKGGLGQVVCHGGGRLPEGVLTGQGMRGVGLVVTPVAPNGS